MSVARSAQAASNAIDAVSAAHTGMLNAYQQDTSAAGTSSERPRKLQCALQAGPIRGGAVGDGQSSEHQLQDHDEQDEQRSPGSTVPRSPAQAVCRRMEYSTPGVQGRRCSSTVLCPHYMLRQGEVTISMRRCRHAWLVLVALQSPCLQTEDNACMH